MSPPSSGRLRSSQGLMMSRASSGTPARSSNQRRSDGRGSPDHIVISQGPKPSARMMVVSGCDSTTAASNSAAANRSVR